MGGHGVGLNGMRQAGMGWDGVGCDVARREIDEIE